MQIIIPRNNSTQLTDGSTLRSQDLPATTYTVTASKILGIVGTNYTVQSPGETTGVTQPMNQAVVFTTPGNYIVTGRVSELQLNDFIEVGIVPSPSASLIDNSSEVITLTGSFIRRQKETRRSFSGESLLSKADLDTLVDIEIPTMIKFFQETLFGIVRATPTEYLVNDARYSVEINIEEVI